MKKTNSSKKLQDYVVELFDMDKIRNASVKLNPERLKIYKHYQYERAKIYYKKEILNESAPYTEDKVLQEYRFTNVKRELDKGSKNIIRTCLSKDTSLENKLLNIVFYRGLIIGNNYHMFDNDEYIDFYNESKEYSEYIKSLKVSKEKTPYLGCGTKNAMNLYFKKNNPDLLSEDWFYKFFVMIKDCKDNYIENYLKKENNIFTLDFVSNNIFGLGNFLKYQIFVDLTYCKEYTRDENDIIISGPGCSLGISLLVEDKGGLTDEEFMVWFREFLKNEEDFNPKEFLHFLPEEKQNWDLMAIENSFCEFSKYIRLLTTNTNQRKYKPTQIETIQDF